jgi:ribosomal protein S18 acetylase RimI-like enzyme
MAGNLRIENPVQKSEPEPDPAVFVTRVSLAIDQGTQQPRSDVDTRVDDDGDALIAAACAALRVRCFYKYKRETERDPSSDFFLFGEAPSENEKDAKRVWRERRERAETNRARRFVDLGMRVVSFAATSRAPCDATLFAERQLLDEIETADAKPTRRDLLDAPNVGEDEDEDSSALPRLGRDRAARVRFHAETTQLVVVPTRCLISGKTPLGSRREVVGTVDLHVGARLPGEFLEGSLPRRAKGGAEWDEGDDEVDDETHDAAASDFAKVVGFDEDDEAEGVASHATSGVDIAVAAAAAFAQCVCLDDSVTAASALSHHSKATAHLPLSDPADGGEGYAGGGGLDGRRAYAFNVCVAEHRRRRGVAARLLRAAHAHAKETGVEFVYCHVERHNAKARRLYEQMGYVPELEESDWLAGKLGRPPRVLMRKNL